jgi:hypothetical protein
LVGMFLERCERIARATAKYASRIRFKSNTQ